MTRGCPPLTVEAANWLIALGQVLHDQGEEAVMERLLCEALPDGTLLARDGQRRWVVQALEPSASPPRPRRPNPGGLALVSAEEEDAEEPPTPVSWVERQQRLAELAVGELTVEEAIQRQQRPNPALEQIRDAGTAVMAWELALGMCAELAPSESGVAVQVTPHEGLIIVAALGPHAHKLRAGRLPPGRGFVGFCVDKARPFIVNDVRRDPRHWAEMDTQTGYRTRTVLCAPVLGEGLCFGCLELLNPPDDGLYTRDMLDAVRPIAEALGARLFRAGIRGRRP